MLLKTEIIGNIYFVGSRNEKFRLLPSKLIACAAIDL